MRHTRFVVVKMRELLKTALFAVLGVIIVVGLITFFLRMGDGESAGLYRDGTYEAELPLGQGTASVSVEIKDGRIADVTVTDDAETVSVMYPMVEDAAEEVAQQVVQNQSVENITVADTHTYSAQAVLDAVIWRISAFFFLLRFYRICFLKRKLLWGHLFCPLRKNKQNLNI